jgi:hypothetical protein
MKSKVRKPLLGNIILLAVGLAILPMLTARQSYGKARAVTEGAVAVISVADHARTNPNIRAALEARLRYAMSHSPKTVKVISKGCGCPAGAGTGTPSPGFGQCLKNCMADSGISANSLIMCGASCALSETGVGAIMCAICLGISVTVVEVCAFGCAAYGGRDIGGLLGPDGMAKVKHRRSNSGSLQAKIHLPAARGAS